MRARPTTLFAVLSLLLAVPAFPSITGTVINGDGQPVAGAKISIFVPEPLEARRARLVSATPQRTPLAATTSDSKGNFSFDSPKEAAVVDVRIEAAGFAPDGLRALADEELGAIALTPAEPKKGTITANGKPLAGATVTWLGSSELVTTTDADGHYTIPDPAKWANRILITHPDLAPLEENTSPFIGDSKKGVNRTLTAGAKVSGKVVAEDGTTPVKDAVVTIDGWPAGTTGEDGKFTIAHAATNWNAIEARAGERVGTRVRSAAGELVIKLAKAASISGSLREAKGQLPVPAAEVRLTIPGPFGATAAPRSAFTDAKGNYSITGLAPGTFQLIIIRPGYSADGPPVALTAGLKKLENLYATPLARLSGTVLDENRHPVAGAHVGMRRAASPQGMGFGMRRMGGNGSSTATSAPDGRWVIRGVEPDVNFEADAFKKGYPTGTSSSVKLAGGERKSGIVITIPRGIAITGKVTDRDGKPLSGTSVVAEQSRNDGGAGMFRRMMGNFRPNNEDLVQSGSDGTYTIRVKEGTYDLVFKREGYAVKTVRAQQVAPGNNKPVDVTLQPGVEITGRVTRSGQGIEGVNVNAMSEIGNGGAVTGPDGSFTISDLTPGPVMVVANKQDEFINQIRNVSAPAKDLIIDVPGGGKISGRVIDKESHQPITSFQAGISTSRSGGGMMFMTPPQLRSFTSDDGSFLLENVPPGPTQVVVIAPSYTTGRVSNLSVEDGKTLDNVEVAMDAGSRVTGRVTGTDGAPISGANVTLGTSGSAARVIRIGAGSEPSANTDPNGDYVLEAVESGEKTLDFSANGYLPESKTITISGKETRVDVQLSSGMHAGGQVVNDSGVPVADARVLASGAAGAGNVQRTDASGNFTMDGLAPGHYTFSATKSGYASGVVRDFDITSNAPLRIVLKTGGTIFGHVSGLTDTELQNASVTASNSNGQAGAAIDSAGNYRIDGAPTGTVRVLAATGRGFTDSKTSPAQSVDLAPGGSQQVDITFKSDTVIRGRITRNGVPVAGAGISFSPKNGKAQTISRTTADGDGRYAVTGLDDAPYTVTVFDIQKNAPYSQNYDVAGSATLDIDMKSVVVRGRVLDSSTNEPLKEAVITLKTGSTPEAFFTSRNGATDNGGSFLIDFVPPGQYTVSADLPGYAHQSQQINVTDAGAEEVVFKLDHTDGVTLRVVDGRDGRPLNANVRVVDARGVTIYDNFFRFTDTAGALQLSTIPAGTYQATVSAMNYAPVTTPIQSPGQQTVSLTPGGTLSLHTKSTGLRGKLIDAMGREYMRTMGSPIFVIPRGDFPMYNISPGRYTLQVLDSKDAIVQTTPLVIEEGGVVDITI